MARPNREAIDTFISITGASEAVAVQKLEENGGDLNEAVNAHFSEGDRTTTRQAPIAAPQNDFMDIDDPLEAGSRGPSLPLLSAAGRLDPFSLLDPNFSRSLFNTGSDLTSRTPFVSHPREVREIPIEVKNGDGPSSHSGLSPTIEDVTGTAHEHGLETHGTVIIDDDDDEYMPSAPTAPVAGRNEQGGVVSRPSAPDANNLRDYSNDIEEEMIRAAIEASKREVEGGHSTEQFVSPNDIVNPGPQQRQSRPDDSELAQAVSLSLKTAEQEKALREQVEKVGASDLGASKSVDVEELANSTLSNGRRQGFVLADKGTSSQSKLEAGSSSINDEAEDVDEQPLVRHRTRHASSSMDSAKDIGETEVSLPSSPEPEDVGNQAQHNGNVFPSEWGGISSEEHDEAVMLEAAMFGGIPEGTGYFPYDPHHLMRTGLEGTQVSYPERMPRPPSPSLTAQRLLREQQDDEYLAALQADREKELKAIEEAETRRLEERRREEESLKKLEEEQEFERHIAAKEASLPQEPASDDENAITLQVRMPDGSRRGRRFVKSDKLQSLFDFIDVGRGVKPGTYRLVRPYPRRAFSDGEIGLSLNELGLTSKQEALYLELI